MDAAVLIQVVTTGITVAAALVAFLQVRVMRVTANRELTQAALDRLLDPDMRAARRTVYSLAGKPVENWTPAEISAVETVGGHFSHLGFIIKTGAVPAREFTEMWGYRFIRSFAVIEPYLREERIRIALPDHWIYFEWLARTSFLNLQTRDPWWNSKDWTTLQNRTAGLVATEGLSRERFFPERGRAQLDDGAADPADHGEQPDQADGGQSS